MTVSDTRLERIRRLAEAVRRHQEAIVDTLTSRDRAILEAAEDGLSHGAIAKAAGLARTTVQQIITNTAAKRPAHDDPQLPFER